MEYPNSGKKANLCLTMALKGEQDGDAAKVENYLAKAVAAEAEHQTALAVEAAAIADALAFADAPVEHATA